MQTRVLFFKPGFTGLTAFKPWYPGLTYGGSLVSGRLANRVAYYKQLRGGQMEVWLDSRYQHRRFETKRTTETSVETTPHEH